MTAATADPGRRRAGDGRARRAAGAAGGRSREGPAAVLAVAAAGAALALVGLAGCAAGPPPGAGPRSALPPIPDVRGDLDLYVAYPDAGDPVAATDSNFIFGTTGTGAAELTVDGRPVEVEPNGAFLAWVPVPERAAGDTVRYRLVARVGDRADTVVHPVLLPARPFEGEGAVWVDTAALSGLAERWGPPSAALERSIRAAPGLEAWVEVHDTGAAGPLRFREESPGRRPPADTVRDGRGGARHRRGAGRRGGAGAAAPPADTVPPDSAEDVRAAGRRGAAPGEAPRGEGTAAPGASRARASGRIPLEELRPGRYRLRVELGRLVRAAERARAPVDAPADTATDSAKADTPRPRRPSRREGAARTGPGPGDGAPKAGRVDTLRLLLRVTDGRDTASASGRLAVRLLDPGRPPVATLAEEPHPVHGIAGRVPARPSPRGSYAWLLPPGSSAPADRRVGDRVRLRLGPHLHAWVTAEDVVTGPERALPPEREAPVATVGRVEAEPRDDRVRLRVPVGRRLPAHVEPAGRRTLRLVVHGGLGATERMVYGPADPLLRGLRWRQEPGPRWVLAVRLAEPVWGWDLRWADVEARARIDASASPGRPGGEVTPDAPSDAGGETGRDPAAGDAARLLRRRGLPRPTQPGTLVLDVRRPPEVDPDEPLRGVRVAVDPGHPPVGAEGPTGLTEAEANLGVARELKRLLADAGAEPVLVRTDSAAVGLYERRRRAVEAGADLLVSVHNNALPDGLRPFGREGTSTYYFHPHARRLARRVQQGMLGTMGLRDLGVRWGNLALPRESWMPSVLTEGAFMMFPRHEAALRTRAFREAYARGVLEGLRGFLRDHALGALPARRK